MLLLNMNSMFLPLQQHRNESNSYFHFIENRNRQGKQEEEQQNHRKGM